MNYIQFREAIKDYGVFSTKDISKLFPGFDSRRLVEWQQKGYLQKLTNKWYHFSDIAKDENMHFRIANCLCRPSYVSMESALSLYDFIPEGVYTIQSITTRKTIHYETVTGSYQYRSLRSSLFFGYRATRNRNTPVLIAEPEKAILDYLYLNPRIHSLADMEGLRLNMTAIRNRIDWEKLEKYAACFESATLKKRLFLIKKIESNAATI
jgi:predicted transcriptional regulator of viral defense system